MQALQAVMLAGRAVTLRSARLPRPMAAEAAAMGKGVLPRVLAVVEATSVRRVRQHLRQQRTVEAVVVTVPLLLVSVP